MLTFSRTKDKRVYSNKSLAPWKLLIFVREIIPFVLRHQKTITFHYLSL